MKTLSAHYRGPDSLPAGYPTQQASPTSVLLQFPLGLCSRLSLLRTEEQQEEPLPLKQLFQQDLVTTEHCLVTSVPVTVVPVTAQHLPEEQEDV